MQQIVHCRHLVVLVAVQALRRIVLLEAVAFEVSEERGLDRDLVFANDQALAPANWRVGLVPGVLLDLLSSESLVRVGLQDFVYQIHARC